VSIESVFYVVGGYLPGFMEFELVYLVIEFDFVFGLGAVASMVFSGEGSPA